VTVASFATWLSTDNPVAVFTFVVLNALAWWVVVLAHELGHAAVGLTRTEGLVIVRVGRRSPKWRRRFGRLLLELGPVPMFSASEGEAEVLARLGRRARVMLALAGPVAGSFAAAALIVLGSRFEFLPLEVIGWVAMVLDFANLVPFRFRGLRSDGAYLLAALRDEAPSVSEDDGELDAITTRWFALVTNARTTFDRCSPEILANVLVLLGRARNDRSREGRTLIRLALAGWCWRHAERGDTTQIRDRVLDVRHRASLTGMAREATLVAAASELADEQVDLASVSPTAGSLERGLECGLTVKAPESLPQEQQRFAFRFGVAMHDVVSISR
jgi:hypothetical protein